MYRRLVTTRQNKKTCKHGVWKVRPCVLVQLGVVMLCIAFCIVFLSFYRVRDYAMYPSIQMGDLVIAHRLFKPAFGDVVLYSSSEGIHVGRVAAVPGQYVEFFDGFIYVDNAVHPCERSKESEAITLDYDSFFIIEDSSDVYIYDSFSTGPISSSNILGSAFWLFRCRQL